MSKPTLSEVRDPENRVRGIADPNGLGDHMSYRVYRVGLVSDTHGLVRREAIDALRDSDLIIHCGDVGHSAVLDAFRTLAPVRAIRGNNDKDAWASSLPTRDVVEIGTHTIYVIHDLSELDLDPVAAGFAAVASGHSHKPAIEKRGEILYVNPGSAGPRRFALPVTVAKLVFAYDRCEAKILQLAPLTTQSKSGRGSSRQARP
jgi:putative phosphoesterase